MAKLSGSLQLISNRITGNNRYAYALLGMLCVLVYANSLDVPFYFDDYAYIVENPFIRSFGAVFDRELMARTTLYEDVKNCVISRPVAYLTFAADFALHQTAVAGYHLVNVAIHLLNSCLVYLLIVLTYSLYLAGTPLAEGSPEFGSAVRRSALFVAALFAVHPVMTNAVTYICQRMTSLATLFYLLTLVLYARCCLAGGKTARTRWYLLSLVSGVAALQSKEIAFTLPFMLLVYDGIFCQRSLLERARRLLPYLVCAVAVFALLGGVVGRAKFPPQNSAHPSIQQVVSFAKAAPLQYLTTQFATNPNATSVASMAPLEYLITQFRVVVTYQRMLLVPAGLNLVHDYPFYRNLLEPPVLLSLGVHLVLLLVVLYLLRRSATSPGGNLFLYRMAAFGIIWFYLSLSMECGIIPMDDHILEHRMYLPAFGFITAGVALVQTGMQRWGERAWPFNLFFVAVILLFATLTIIRNEQWRDPLVFWQDALAKSPNKKRIHGYLGNVYRDRGDMPKALREYRLMLATDFRYWQDHFELGEMLLENGMYHEAVEEFLTVLKIRPDQAFVYGRLAEAYSLLGDERLAGEALRRAAAGSKQEGEGAGPW